MIKPHTRNGINLASNKKNNLNRSQNKDLSLYKSFYIKINNELKKLLKYKAVKRFISRANQI